MKSPFCGDSLQVRQAVSNVCALSLKDIRLIKDKVTNTSRGFCFVELNSIEVSWSEKVHIKFIGTNST